MLSKLASASLNLPAIDSGFFELNVFFAYFATLMELNPTLIMQIIWDYKKDC